jgi:hypothetical protein
VLDIAGSRGLKIFFDIRIGEAAIVQVDTQLLDGNGAARKEGVDRFKDDLMLRLDESVLGESLNDSLPALTRDRFIA